MDDSFLSVLWKNFLTFDFIIFILAAVTVFLFVCCMKRADELYKKMHLIVFIPADMKGENVKRELENTHEYDIITMRRSQMRIYSLFANCIMIFPLLGILGTVLSLLPLVKGLGTETVTQNFFGALTSTLWGLIFAIIFKLADGYLSGKIEDNETTVQLYLSRNNKERQ